MEFDQPAIIINPEERDNYRERVRRRGLVGFVMRVSGGLVKTETAANYVLFVFALLALVASLIIFTS
ncbi:MAG: hypothetical protein AAB505_02445 [Patescibacteria group bacterium]